MMSGPQFIHFQSYSRKANKAGQCVEQVIGEAARAPQYSKHVANPLPPTVAYGDSIEELSKQHDEMVAAGFVDVALQGGRVARRGIRKDRHTLLTAVASYPVPVALVQANADARRNYEQWRSLNIAWLRRMFYDGLVSVVEHWDEAHPHIHAYILPLNDPSCSARQMNPAWRAKEEAEGAARLAGEAPARAAQSSGLFAGRLCPDQAISIEPDDLRPESCEVRIKAQKGHAASWVTVSPEMMAELEALKPKRPKNLKTRQLLSPRVFGYGSPTGYNNRWKTICKRAGIPYLSAHPAGRHGFFTELVVRQGVDPVTAAKAGRWSDPNLPMRIYAHAETDEAAIRARFRMKYVQAAKSKPPNKKKTKKEIKDE